MLRKLSSILWITCVLAACSMETNYAPVMDATIEHIPKSGTYRVLPHETLYSIAWRYGLDYRYLANRNHIAPPYHVEAGQIIYLKGKPAQVVMQQPMAASKIIAPPPPPAMRKISSTIRPVVKNNVVEHETNLSVKYWRWPARGKITSVYSGGNKGINISGHYGDPIYATAAGQVVYSGNGLRGYGNLIIIKHNNTYLTAYADNSSVLVKEGEWVRAGQQIAEMGKTNRQQVMLHFEIRRNGRPVNPLSYLRREV